MEYIKTQLQLQKRIPGQEPPYTGVISGLRYTVRTTGFLSLYSGLGVGATNKKIDRPLSRHLFIFYHNR